MNGEMQQQDARAAAPDRSAHPAWMESRLTEIAGHVDHILANMPESRLEAQRLVADTLGMMPSAEMLHALSLLADEETPEELRKGQAHQIVLLRLLVDLEIHALTQHAELDLEVLERAIGTIPDLIHRAKAFDKEFDRTGDTLGPRDQERLATLKKGLMPEVSYLQAFAVLVPRVTHLARAATEGRIDSMSFLTREDAALFRNALPGASELPPNRICLDATALRWAIQEDLVAWDRIRPQPRSEDEGSEDRDEERSGWFGAEDLRLAILEHLKLDVNAYHVLMKRMQAQQDAARSEGADEVVQETSSAQRALFATYLELTATVRNPAGKAATEDDKEAAAARDRLLREIQEVEDSGMAPSEQVKEEVLLEALTAIRDHRNEPAKMVVPAGARRKKRDKLRRYALVGLAGILAVVAGAVNISFMMQGNRAPDPIQVKASEFASAMPVNKVTAVGPMMISEVPAWTWERMSATERTDKVQEMGRLAEQKGFIGVFLMDDKKKELATWSERNGPRILDSKKPAQGK